MTNKSVAYEVRLKNAQLQKDASKARNIFKKLGTEADNEVGKINQSFSSLSGSVATLTGALTFTAALNHLYQFSADFDKSMREVATISKEVAKDLSGSKRKILELTTQIPIEASQAAKALYQITSAGFSGAEGMTVLEASAKAAIAGVTDTATAADTITTVLNAYRLNADQASIISDKLFKTVELGKTTFGELGQYISTAAPIAASFGVDIDELLSSIATLTQQGTPTAQAMTQIRSAIVAATKVLGDGAFENRTFQEALQEIANKAGGSETELRKLIPEIEAFNGVLGLTGMNGVKASKDLEKLTNSLGATKTAYKIMLEESSKQNQLLINNVHKKFAEFGDGLLNVSGDISSFLNNAFDSGAIDKVIASVGVLVVALGTYKAQLVVTNALRSISNNAQYQAEAQALTKLISEKELQNLGIKEGTILSQEQQLIIKEKIASDLESLTIESEKAQVALIAAQEEHQLALKRALSSKQLVKEKEKELLLATQTGNSKKIAIAQEALLTAQEQRHVAVKARKNTADLLSIRRTKSESAVKAVNSLQTSIGTTVDIGATTAKNLLSLATLKLATAYNTMKVAFMTNPFGFIITAITTLLSVIMMLDMAFGDTTKSQEELSQSMDEINKKVLKEKAHVEVLVAQIKNENLARDEKTRKLKELIALSPSHLKGLTLENIATKEGTEAIELYLKSIKKKILLQQKQKELEKSIKREQDAKEGKNDLGAWAKGALLLGAGGGGYGTQVSEVVSASDKVSEINKRNKEEVIEREQAIQKKIIDDINNISQMDQPKEKGKGTPPVLQDINGEIAKTKREIKRIQDLLDALRNGSKKSTNYAADIKAAEKSLKEQKDLLSTLEGHSTQKNKNEVSSRTSSLSRLKNQQYKYERELYELKRKSTSDKIALIDLEESRTIDAIKKEKQAYLNNAKKEGKKTKDIDTSIFDKRIEIANNKALLQKKKLSEAQDKEFDKMLNQFSTYEEERLKIKQKYQEKIELLQSRNTNGQYNDNIAIANKALDKELADLDSKFQGTASQIAKLFGDMKDKSLEEIQELVDKGKALLEFLKGDFSEDNSFGLTEAQFNTIKSDPSQLKAILDQVHKLENSGAKASSAFKLMGDGLDDIINSGKNLGKLQGGLDNLSNGLSSAFQMAGLLADTLTNISELTDSQELGDVGEGISQVTQVASGAIAGAQAGAAFGPAGAAIGATLGAAKEITSILANNKRNREKLKAQIKANQEQEYWAEFEINKLYRQRYEWAKKIGESKLHHIKREGEELKKQSSENDKEQNELMNKLHSLSFKSGEHFEKTGWFGWGKGKIVEEWSSLGGKSWKEIERIAANGDLSEEGMKFYKALKASRKEGEDLAKKQEQYLEEVRESLTGSTYDSLVDGIVQGFKDGKRSASDFAKSFEDIMKGAISSSISMLADKKLRKWYVDFAKMGEGGYTKKELEEAKRGYVGIVTQLSQQAKEMEKLLGIKLSDKFSSQQSGASKGFQTMSQDTGNELNGRFTAIQMGVGKVNLMMEELKGLSLISIKHLSGIERNTKELYEVNDHLEKIVSNTKNL